MTDTPADNEQPPDHDPADDPLGPDEGATTDDDLAPEPGPGERANEAMRREWKATSGEG